MAVASGRAGRVLARPLFRRLNVHVRTLNASEVIRIRTSKVGKRLPIIVQISQKGNVALGYVAILVYSMAISYCDKARAARGRCARN